MSQGCHTCNWTDQQPEVMGLAICFLQMPLMKRKCFRVGQVNRSKQHPLHSGQVLSATPGNDQVLSIMAGNDQALSTMTSKCPKLFIIASKKCPCPKVEGAGDNGSANIEQSFTPVSPHTYSV